VLVLQGKNEAQLLRCRASSGLEYLRARYYDPATGRFLGRDPVPYLQRYAYAGSNPVNLTDPTGLTPSVASAMAATAACLASVAGRMLDINEGNPCAGELAALNAAVEAMLEGVDWCWNSDLCRSVGVSVGVVACSAATSGWGAVGCAAAGTALLSYEDAKACSSGDTGSCVSVGITAAIETASAGTGRAATWPAGGGLRVAIHGPHHRFDLLGRNLPHIQLNWWTKGVKDSGGALRIPLPDSLWRWLNKAK
jgi:hypothetical protein